MIGIQYSLNSVRLCIGEVLERNALYAQKVLHTGYAITNIRGMFRVYTTTLQP